MFIHLLVCPPAYFLSHGWLFTSSDRSGRESGFVRKWLPLLERRTVSHAGVIKEDGAKFTTRQRDNLSKYMPI